MTKKEPKKVKENEKRKVKKKNSRKTDDGEILTENRKISNENLANLIILFSDIYISYYFYIFYLRYPQICLFFVKH